jgi:putative heme-binding domain-containing protein
MTMRTAFLALLCCVAGVLAQRPPHGQDKLPGPALSPAEAIKKMKVPEGFTVELVAAEPDLVNPIAMTFDEKGRVWVTESFEYPRRSAGPGKDRVKCIEIGKDGKASKATVFAEGLNIPSGIAVGHGGVWVANSPDILFYKIGKDGKAAGKPEVVVSGFGRTDTHELPNSLTWGPDGWLYGWNGVFNYSHVKHRGKEWKFTCAIFRIHPKTRDFELWCEGTSNPWGIAINEEGHFFASACVIDHLWHLTETGYYHRQGGPYPPHTWPMGSIVKHRHQKAAYCGIHWFDSDAYPEKYRGKLFMGNIHGGCINVDSIKRDGSTYAGKGEPDFLTANDAWFMPVSQKTGPDGSLYILDWYDRYHCYQDANRDPMGIDRLRGRLYRVRYKDTPRAKPFDMAKESDDALRRRLSSGNVYVRETAQRILTERVAAGEEKLEISLTSFAFDSDVPRKARLHALWALIGGGKSAPEFLMKLLAHKDATFRAWGVRAAGNAGKKVGGTVLGKLKKMVAEEKSPDVLVQLAIANNKLGLGGIPTFLTILEAAPSDRLIQHIVWQNMHPLLEAKGEEFAEAIKKAGKSDHLKEILPRAASRILDARNPKAEAIAALYLAIPKDTPLSQNLLKTLTAKARAGELNAATLAGLKKHFLPALRKDFEAIATPHPTIVEALAAFKEEKALAHLRGWLTKKGTFPADRVAALVALAWAGDAAVPPAAARLLAERLPDNHKETVIHSLGLFEGGGAAPVLIAAYATLPDALKPRVIEALTRRPASARALLRQIADKKWPASVLNVTQARALLASKDKALVALVTKHWGTVRTERSPERESIVQQMRKHLSRTKGDVKRGIVVFKNLCGQCHKIHGEGVEVGPDITNNGRASFDQLLSNVFDPSLVIGPGYQAVTVRTKLGLSYTGLLVEEGDKRVVLKVQGGKVETIPRANIEKFEVSKLSMMPEGVEKQLKPQEIADLFAFICLDKHPDDRTARYIPGTPKGLIGGK